MYRKLALGLVAAVSLTAAALAPTGASAKNWYFKHHHGWHGHHHGWHAPLFIAGGYSSCYVTRRVLTKYGYRLRTFNVCY
ncbi:hypothetical protein ACSVBT_17690 [Afipia sp. TerB]